MTTIAIDRTTIVADGLRLWGQEIVGLNTRKLLIRDQRIYGFTGLYPMFSVMVDWHRDGANPSAFPVGLDKTDGWTLIIVDRAGIGKYTSSCPYIERFDPPIAFGAGQDYAIGAMLAGVTAKRAVEIVAGQCTHTGGEIQVIDIAEALGTQIRVAAE